MKFRGLLGSLASMLAIVGLSGPPVLVPDPLAPEPRPGEEGHAPPRRRLGGGCGLEFRDDPAALARAREIRTPAHNAEAQRRAESKRHLAAFRRRRDAARGPAWHPSAQRWIDAGLRSLERE